MTPYFRFLRWLHRFEEQPHYFRPLAGLYAMLWARHCGHDWRFAWRMGLIYWWPKDTSDPTEAQCEALMQFSDTMILKEAEANGDNPAAIKARMQGMLASAMAEAKQRRVPDETLDRSKPDNG